MKLLIDRTLCIWVLSLLAFPTLSFGDQRSVSFNRFSSAVAGKMHTAGSNTVVPNSALAVVTHMAALATADSTQTEITNETGIGGRVNLSEFVKSLNYKVKGGPVVSLIPVLAVNPKFEVSPKYKKQIEALGGKVISASAGEVEEFHNFVEKATRSNIKTLFEKLNPNMKVILASALYVKGEWVHPFNQDKSQTNFKTSKRSVAVKMLKTVAPFGYASTSGFQWVNLPLAGPLTQNERFSVIVALPNLGVNTEAAFKVTLSDVAEQMKENAEDSVLLRIPEFSVASKNDLIAPLKANGIEEIFGDSADFSPLSTGVKSGALYVSQALSKGFFKFGPNGVEAGGVAAMEVSSRGMRPRVNHEVVVDRPFAIFFVDNELGIVHVSAVVDDPTKN